MPDISFPSLPSPHPTASTSFDWQQLIDAMECGVVVYDAQDRLVVCNADFRRLYAPIADLLRPGIAFEQLLRETIARGLIPEASGLGEEWVQQRMRAHRQPGPSMLRLQPDGRWRRISECRLADGGLLAFSIDVTDQVERAQALERALEVGRLAQERLEDAVEALPAGYELWDRNDRLVMCNSELKRQYPLIADLLRPGLAWEDLVRANHARGGLSVSAGHLEAYIAERRTERRLARDAHEHATGDGRWIRSSLSPTRTGMVGVRVDITELRLQREMAQRAQEAAERATTQLSDAIEALSEGFALFDADDRLVLFNARYRSMYTLCAPALVTGATFESILRYGLQQGQFPQASGREEAWLRERIERHRNPPGEPELQELPGNCWLRIEERRTADGGIAGVRSDVTELVRRQQELAQLNAELDRARGRLEELSETDPLTGIANRRRFDRRLAEEWARLERHGVPVSLLLIDVDHFKHYNDHYGHQAGDECLRRVALLLEGCARRATDVVARFGGEEFVVLMPDTGADAGAMQAARCLAVIDESGIAHQGSPQAAHLTLSIGIAHTERAAGGPSTLLRSADLALYAAKSAGRHRAQMGTYPPP